MIVISGTVSVKSETRAQWMRVAQTMSRVSQAEDGCITYRFYADLEDPNLMLLFEVWETEEALAAHFQTDHMAEYRSQIPDLIASPSKLIRYEVSGARSL